MGEQKETFETCRNFDKIFLKSKNLEDSHQKWRNVNSIWLIATSNINCSTMWVKTPLVHREFWKSALAISPFPHQMKHFVSIWCNGDWQWEFCYHLILLFLQSLKIFINLFFFVVVVRGGRGRNILAQGSWGWYNIIGNFFFENILTIMLFLYTVYSVCTVFQGHKLRSKVLL